MIRTRKVLAPVGARLAFWLRTYPGMLWRRLRPVLRAVPHVLGQVINLAVAVMVIATGVQVFAWAADREVPVQAEILGIVGPTHPCGTLRVRIRVFRLKTFSATKQQIVLDAGGQRWIIPAENFPSPAGEIGKPDEFVTQTAIPCEIRLGEAELRIQNSFAMNPVHYFWPVQAKEVKVKFEVTRL